MQKLISKFMALPIPGKAVIGMVAAGGIFGVCHVLGLTELGYFLGIAMAVVTVVLAIFGLIVEKRDKKKAADVEANIADSAAATPSGVNKVADRAKLDDLRRQFETGVQTFRDYGKNLYDMPWYVVVGEPGSGKTEAIRHSGIGFPPGLQDQLQGTGGTVNMNWWFTDQSVILDTAGRLMFEEVAPGENNEWKEFLKLLRTNRPNCPINGMMLVIPADTLITDKPDEIEKKAGKIAQQFDQIQRSLGVRFPVFVLITKADLINGFREFFDDITDPRLTAQMLGWSNPSDLDEPFKPDRVEDHLDSLRQHLLQRRFGLLQDPIHTEDPKGRRIDQVDALYKFPEAVTELAPRLRRYLEMIFVSGEWSQKPLFLRGIYFTSSMRDGDALDADLAEVLGVGVGSLPEGKLWERERSYFLRDVFLDKVFRERGLVTRAANAGQVKRKRALLISGAAAAASLLLGVMIWYSYSQTKAKIQNPRDFWVEVEGAVQDLANDELVEAGEYTPAEMVRQFLSPISVSGADASSRKFEIENGKDASFKSGDAEVNIDDRVLTKLEVFERAREYYQKNSSSSGLFALVAALPGGGNDIFKRQLPAQRRLFDQLVLVRAIEVARRDFIEQGRNRAGGIGWGEDERGTEILASLISLEVGRVIDPGEPFSVDTVERLVRFAGAVGDSEFDEEAMPRFREYVTWLLETERSWPPDSLPIGTETATAAVEQGIESFNAYWRDPSQADNLFGQLKRLETAGGALSSAQNGLAVASQELDSVTAVDEFRLKTVSWNAAYGRYRAAYDEFLGALGAIDSRWIEGNFESTALVEAARDAVWESASNAYDTLIERFGDSAQRDALDSEDPLVSWLLDQRGALVAAKERAEVKYKEDAERLVASIRNGDVADHMRYRGVDRVFSVRSNLYEAADSVLSNGYGTPSGSDLHDALDSIRKARNAGVDQASGDDLSAARETARRVYAAAARLARYDVMNAEAEALKDWRAMLSRAAPTPLPSIPLTGLSSLRYEAELVPENNRGVRDAFAELRAAIGRTSEDGSAYVLDPDELARAVADIEAGGLSEALERFDRFWTEDVPAALVVRPDGGMRWVDVRNVLLNNTSQIYRSFEELRGLMAEALGEPDVSSDERVGSLARAIAAEDGNKALRGDIQSKIVSRWSRLSQDPAEAGTVLRLSADANSVLGDYFPLEQNSAFSEAWEVGPEETYWRSFTLAAVELIARGVTENNRGGLESVGPLCDRFPITIDADRGRPLSQPQIERIAATLDDFAILRSDDPVAVGESPYSWINSLEIRGPLDRISGRGLLDQDTTVKRLRRALRVAQFLSDSNRKVTFMLADLGPGHPKNTREMRRMCEQIEVEGKPNVFGDPGYTYLEKQEVFDKNYVWSLPMDGTVEIRFQNEEKQGNGEPPITSGLGGWGPIAAINSEPLQSGFGDNGERVEIWPIEFRLSNGRSFWMGAVFVGGDAEALIGLRETWLRARN